MVFIIGAITVIGCVIGGYLMHHGVLGVLWQPNEVVIIVGAAIGAFLISNPKDLIFDVLGSFKNLFKGKPYTKTDYIELLSFIFTIFKLIKTKGLLQVENHIENPVESEIFNKYPLFSKNKFNVELFCDYLRILTMGIDNHHQMEDLLEKEIEIIEHEKKQISAAIGSIADGMPALGIVAAVLGVITTMGSINEPPAVLGGLIGAALVGTFLGVLIAYGYIAPISQCIDKFASAEVEYLKCIKAAIIAHMQGYAPSISIEFARKQVPLHNRPTFKELEESVNAAT